jgi:CBS domain-containing protein
MSDQTFPDPEEFQDPLENYDAKVYDDPIEEALAEETVAEILHEPFATISLDASVREAVEKLAGLHVACLLVEKDGELVGVFSHRDVLERVSLEFEDAQDRPICDFMTTNPAYVYETDASAAALAVTAVCGFRHVPVLNLEHQLVGIVSPQRVTSFLQRYATRT